MTEHFIYGGILLVVAIVCARLLMSERQTTARLRKERHEIEVEEHRLFDFLHGLGSALQEDASALTMHRYVVNGVATVVGAEAGILYLMDPDANRLVPIFQTKIAAAVVAVTDEILEIVDPGEAAQKYRTYVRLSPLEPDKSFIGKTLKNDGVVVTSDLTSHEFFEGKNNPFQDNLCVLAAPLIYGQKRVGVLAMTRKEREFSQNDVDVFASVAEQSAFALGSAIIHSEAHEKRRLERELQQASEIQKILLPRESPKLSDYKLAAAYRAARHVSGDYFDYVKVDEDRYGVAIGDVCGKGIAASLIVAMCRSNLRARASENLSPASVLHQVNRLIFPDIKADMFVSLLYLILERGSDEMTIARAGHEPPLLFRIASREIEKIEIAGMAAGVDPGSVFKRSVKDFRVQMDPGDILILYTDGIIEAENRKGEEFTLAYLEQTIRDLEEYSADLVVETVMKKLDEFTKGMAQSDDITLIAIEKR